MNYRVQRGDTLWDLSRKFGIPLQQLLAQVPESVRRDPRKLQPGMELNLRPSVVEASPPQARPAAMQQRLDNAAMGGVPGMRAPRPGDVTADQRNQAFGQQMGAALAGPPAGAAMGAVGGPAVRAGQAIGSRLDDALFGSRPPRESEAAAKQGMDSLFRKGDDYWWNARMNDAQRPLPGPQPQLQRPNPARMQPEPLPLSRMNPQRGFYQNLQGPPRPMGLNQRPDPRTLRDLQEQARIEDKWNAATRISDLQHNPNMANMTLEDLAKLYGQ